MKEPLEKLLNSCPLDVFYHFHRYIFQRRSCSLHLTQKFQQLYPLYHMMPILSKESAVGLVFATGNMNRTVQKDVDVFRSSDAGRSWHEVRISSENICICICYTGRVRLIQSFHLNRSLFDISFIL